MCVYMCTHTCAYTSYIFTRVHVYLSSFIYMYVHVYIDVSAHISVCIHACVYPCTYVYICLYICIYTQAYMYTIKDQAYTCAHRHMHVREHALCTCLFISMCALIYRHENACVYMCTCIYAHVYAFSLSRSLTFKLPEQFYNLTFLPGGFVSFHFGSTSKSCLFI